MYTNPPPLQPPPAYVPHYLKHTLASLYKEGGEGPHNETMGLGDQGLQSSLYATYPPSSTFQTSAQQPALSSTAPKKTKKKTASQAHHPPSPSPSPINPHYPPPISKGIWISEAHRGGRIGRKGKEAFGKGDPNAKERVMPF